MSIYNPIEPHSTYCRAPTRLCIRTCHLANSWTYQSGLGMFSGFAWCSTTSIYSVCVMRTVWKTSKKLGKIQTYFLTTKLKAILLTIARRPTMPVRTNVILAANVHPYRAFDERSVLSTSSEVPHCLSETHSEQSAPKHLVCTLTSLMQKYAHVRTH